MQFNAPAGADVGDSFEAIAFVRTSDPDAPEVGAAVRGIVKRGEDGANEPSLQDVFDAYALGIDAGDGDPSTTDFDFDDLLAGDGVEAELFEAVDPDRPVAFEAIAVYSPPATPTVGFGYYDPTFPQDLRRLGEVVDAQALSPETVAPAKFTPETDSGRFGLYLQSPIDFFADAEGRGRVVYSDPALNAFEPDAGERRKVVAYPIPDVEDAYAVAFEEFENETDYNDLVLVARNVRPIRNLGPRLSVLDDAGVPQYGRVVFSEIDPAQRDTRPGINQIVRDTRTVTLVNTGEVPMTLGDADATGPFDVQTETDGETIGVGGRLDLTVAFGADEEGPDDGLYEETLTVEFADDEGNDETLEIALGGYYMPYSEDNIANDPDPTDIADRDPNEEPTLNEIVATFGYATDVGTDAERMTGTPEAVGDEVLSEFWRAADADRPVEVYQLAAFHNTNSSDEIYWFPRSAAGDETQAADASTLILEHGQDYAQSMLPAQSNGDAFSIAAFDPAGQEFGLRVVNEYSVDDFNDVAAGPQDQHLFRFYPARDPAGSVIEDAWIVSMDFIAFNFDYNDNVYLVRNMEPADGAENVVGLTAGRFDGDDPVGVYWARPDGVDRVRLFTSDDGTDFAPASGSLAREHAFFDVGDLDDDEELHVRVVSLDANGNAGNFSQIRVA